MASNQSLSSLLTHNTCTGFGDLGAIGVFIGLALVIRTEPEQQAVEPELSRCSESTTDGNTTAPTTAGDRESRRIAGRKYTSLNNDVESEEQLPSGEEEPR